MEGCSAMVRYLVERVKEEVFSPAAAPDVRSLVPPSAYETAWVAMVPSPHDPRRPMFPKCLEWIVHSQREDGFWGDRDDDSLHALDSITSTLACVAALRTWNTGRASVQKGLQYLNANMEKILAHAQRGGGGGIPRWFAVMFPGMIELAQAQGLEVVSSTEDCASLVDSIFRTRNEILSTNDREDCRPYTLPMARFLEALPAGNRPTHEEIVGQQMEDGSLFRSPSATACAFMVTGDKRFKNYLEGMVKTCRNVVPATFPADGDLINLCLVDHLSQLGCAGHFREETRAIMDRIYSDWLTGEPRAYRAFDLSQQIQKSFLTFQLLREQGYDVHPGKFCWFMENKELLGYIEENHGEFSTAMHSVYRAARLMFPGEEELGDAKLFAEKILRKSLPGPGTTIDNSATLADFQKEIQDELGVPWLARMEHLEHRRYIERRGGCDLSLGKASPCRLLSPKFTTQLAVEDFTNRQLIYGSELEELKRWSSDTGLSSMGFGREKTAYCYFLIAASVNLPVHAYDLRMITAQCAILVTVIDDFFDEKASLEELKSLVDAVRRWEGESLTGHSKVLFDALDNLVNDVSARAFARHGHDVRNLLLDMWRETFESWLKESSWSMNRDAPPISEYLENAKISIAIQVMTLPACCLLAPELPKDSDNSRYPKITELTMIASRLLNDIQSYQKEIEAGKFNMVPLYMKENPEAGVEDSFEHIRGIIDKTEKEFVEMYVTASAYAGIPQEWKDMHLGTFKSFRMLFDSSNAFDSSTALLRSISSAFYDPLVVEEDEKQLARSSWSYTPLVEKEMWRVLLGGDQGGTLLVKNGTTAGDDGIRREKDWNAKPSRKMTLNIVKPSWSSDRRRAPSRGWKISMSPYASLGGSMMRSPFTSSATYCRGSCARAPFNL